MVVCSLEVMGEDNTDLEKFFNFSEKYFHDMKKYDRPLL